MSPDDIFLGSDGRWRDRDGVDVTDLRLWWRCERGHSWQASVAERTRALSPAECPHCPQAGGVS